MLQHQAHRPLPDLHWIPPRSCHCSILSQLGASTFPGAVHGLAGRIADIIDTEDGLLVSDVVLAETAYVLTSVYRVPRASVVDHLIDLIQKENISLFSLDKSLALQALLLCRPSGRVSFADALVWAAAHSSGTRTVYTLDDRFPKDGLDVRKPS